VDVILGQELTTSKVAMQMKTVRPVYCSEDSDSLYWETVSLAGWFTRVQICFHTNTPDCLHRALFFWRKQQRLGQSRNSPPPPTEPNRATWSHSTTPPHMIYNLRLPPQSSWGLRFSGTLHGIAYRPHLHGSCLVHSLKMGPKRYPETSLTGNPRRATSQKSKDLHPVRM
jgi:hypothetical protein